MKLKKIDFHRNGCCGLEFYVAIFQQKEGKEKRDMLIIRPPKEHDKETGMVNCFVFDLGELAKGNISFPGNSWRGDHFHEEMDQAIEKDQNNP